MMDAEEKDVNPLRSNADYCYPREERKGNQTTCDLSTISTRIVIEYSFYKIGWKCRRYLFRRYQREFRSRKLYTDSNCYIVIINV